MTILKKPHILAFLVSSIVVSSVTIWRQLPEANDKVPPFTLELHQTESGFEFSKIPGGTYQRGGLTNAVSVPIIPFLDRIPWFSDRINETNWLRRIKVEPDLSAPLQHVWMSEFYMQTNLVTIEQWEAVRVWGKEHGYEDLPKGVGKAADHPVCWVSWNTIIQWANAASEKDGLKPCYTLGGVIYRTGKSSAVECDWSANGYRLPTELEWEVAARGGLIGKRFPWGDTISHNEANYRGDNSYCTYDLSQDYHPKYASGQGPYTSPVGSFAPNRYGLYDMAGNVEQWCWDWYGDYETSPDTRGASKGPFRVMRGGDWSSRGSDVRCAQRPPPQIPGLVIVDDYFGFRLARSCR